jgi:hypothetical protein
MTRRPAEETDMREPEALSPAPSVTRMRISDCTTYLEPTPPGSEDPYIAVPGRKTFEDGHVPGADFLDLEGEFSDNTTWLCFHGEWAKDPSLPIESDRADATLGFGAPSAQAD